MKPIEKRAVVLYHHLPHNNKRVFFRNTEDMELYLRANNTAVFCWDGNLRAWDYFVFSEGEWALALGVMGWEK